LPGVSSAGPPGSGGGTNHKCIVQNGACVADSGSKCGTTEGYGTAVAGKCKYHFDGSNLSECIEDSGVTVVILKYYKTACQVYDGTCQCVYLVMTSPSSKSTQVCNCHDQPI
jgi:hypothetical protein